MPVALMRAGPTQVALTQAELMRAGLTQVVRIRA